MRCWREECGFTLVELLAAFAVMAVVLGGALAVHRSALQAYLVGSNKVEVQQAARVALQRVAREIRNACLPAGPTPQIVTAAAEHSLTFTYLEGGVCSAVTYTNTVVANTLTRNGAVVVAGVWALTFTYRDSNDAVTALLANVRRIDITIETQTEDPLVAGRGGVQDVRSHVVTSARIRNLIP
jgi:prepilin-type N-terminal cleavage/methylation domain-containing protein